VVSWSSTSELNNHLSPHRQDNEAAKTAKSDLWKAIKAHARTLPGPDRADFWIDAPGGYWVNNDGISVHP